MDLKTSLKRGPFSEDQANQLNEVLPGLDSGQVQWLNGYLTGIEAFLQDHPTKQTQTATAHRTQAKAEPVWILYGTHTGNCEHLANDAAGRMKNIGREAKVSDMESFKKKELKKIKELLIIVSTDGEGDPPIQAETLLAHLQGKRAPKLNHISYSVLALGDSTYAEFCQTGKDFDAALEKNGAKRIKDRIDCDVDFEDNYEEWIEDIISKSGMSVGNNGELVDAGGPPAPQIETKPKSVYNKKNPFPATVLEKINLNGRHSEKETIHLELDLGDSQLSYEPGDALGIFALNNEKIVDDILSQLKFSGKEKVETHQGTKELREALISDYELTTITQISLKKYAELTNSDKLKRLLEDRKKLSDYLYGRDVLDLIREETFELNPQELISILRKNMPRMYSIASSQEEVEDEVHILVSTVRYNAHHREKEGLCSSFLTDRIQVDDKIMVFVDPNSRFKLPKEAEKPIIMVGPGTGVAPFRSFIQQRDALDNVGKSWLFFGDRHFTTDFLYQSEWLQYRKEGLLTRADAAFSRDQKEKIYVQHKMLEKGKELFEWLEEGAHFYVCGDKDHMAKDVDQALKDIIQTHGHKSEEQAKDYIKQLQKANRYQKDVY